MNCEHIHAIYTFQYVGKVDSTLNGVERWKNRGAGSEDFFDVAPKVFTNLSLLSVATVMLIGFLLIIDLICFAIYWTVLIDALFNFNISPSKRFPLPI